jgi:hypothetical protein
MREFEIFFESLEKEGLQKGRLVYEGEEHIFQNGDYRILHGPKVAIDLNDEKRNFPTEGEKDESTPLIEINLEKSAETRPAEFPISLSVSDEERSWWKRLSMIVFFIGLSVIVGIVAISYLGKKESPSKNQAGNEIGQIVKIKKKPEIIKENEYEKKEMEMPKVKNDLVNKPKKVEKGVGTGGSKEATDKNKIKVIDNLEKKKAPTKIEKKPGIIKEGTEYEKKGEKTPVTAKDTFAENGEEITKSYARTVKTIKFRTLPLQYRDSYIPKVKSIIIPNLKQGIKMRGQISLTLSVDKNGTIIIKNFNEKYLKVLPENKIGEVKKMIYSRIEAISLIPPKDSNEEPVRVENWRVVFQVGTYKGKLILNIIN